MRITEFRTRRADCCCDLRARGGAAESGRRGGAVGDGDGAVGGGGGVVGDDMVFVVQVQARASTIYFINSKTKFQD